jgi:hypothetical protein
VNVGVRIGAGVVGLGLELAVLDAAVRTFLLPRVARVRLGRWITAAVRLIFVALVRTTSTYRAKDHALSFFASAVLLALQATWLGLTVVAFAFGFVAAGAPSFAAAFSVSGSSLFTLGIDRLTGATSTTLEYVEAGVGLTLLALLIAFIPTLYAAFQRRELSVSRLAVRAGTPATPWGIIEIAQSVESLPRLDELFREWEQWFIDVGETHTTLVVLNYYRSPQPEQTWIGALTAVLDAAAIYNAAIDVTPSPSAGLCIRSGWLTLRRLADYFTIDYPLPVTPTLPISVTRGEFDGVLARLERAGVPLVADREAAWRDFAGWRVNYDAIVEAMHTVFVVPRLDWADAQRLPLVGPSNRRGEN